MKIYQFIPLALVVIAAFCAVAQKIGAPIAPIAVIGTVGALLLTLQLEDHKLGDVLAELGRALKH